MMRLRYLLLSLWILTAACLSSCSTGSGVSKPQIESAKLVRAEKIAAESRGDFYIGRRYYVDRMRFWGYLRKPGEPWSESFLVIINEKNKTVPDRLPEIMESEIEKLGDDPTKLKKVKRFGYDHNYEYKVMGSFSGSRVYDPNSNLVLREFILSDYELINPDPGWLFFPNEVYNFKVLPSFLGKSY